MRDVHLIIASYLWDNANSFTISTGWSILSSHLLYSSIVINKAAVEDAYNSTVGFREPFIADTSSMEYTRLQTELSQGWKCRVRTFELSGAEVDISW